jgi:hypothetical protein
MCVCGGERGGRERRGEGGGGLPRYCLIHSHPTRVTAYTHTMRVLCVCAGGWVALGGRKASQTPGILSQFIERLLSIVLVSFSDPDSGVR